MTFDAREPSCISRAIVVKKVEDAVTTGIRYPLAKVALNFDIKVVSVREATKQELEPGHTHEHGHDH